MSDQLSKLSGRKFSGSKSSDTAVQSSIAERNKISRSAFKVWFGSLFGLIAGLLTQTIIAGLYGAGWEMDAYFTALAIPTYLQSVLLSTLSFVFIPAFVRDQSEGREEDAWALVGTFFWLTSVAITTVCALVALFSPRVLSILAPGLSGEKLTLAAQMLGILIFAVPFTGLGNLTAGVQNARNSFFLPAARMALGSVINVIVLLTLYPIVGVKALAWGFLAFSASQAMVTIVPVLRHGWMRRLPFSDSRVQEIFSLLLPLVLFGLFTRATPILERYFASGLPDGELSYLGYSAKLARVAQGLLSSMITTAIFPVMSRSFSKEGFPGLARNFKYGLRLTVAIGLPAVTIASVVSTPLIRVIFEWGKFDRDTTIYVSQVLPLTLLRGVLIYMLGNLVTRVFYVVKDTRTGPIVSGFSVVVYLVAASLLVGWLGYLGLAIADTVYAGSAVIVLLVILLKRNYLSIQTRQVVRYGAAYGMSCLVATSATWITLTTMPEMHAIAMLAIPALVGGLVYLGLLFVVDAAIAVDVLDVGGIRRVLALIPVPSIQRVVGSSKKRRLGKVI